MRIQILTICLFFILTVPQIECSKQNALQVLGFEDWQEPTPQQINAQYKLLMEQYKGLDEKQYKLKVDALNKAKEQIKNIQIQEQRQRQQQSYKPARQQQQQRRPQHYTFENEQGNGYTYTYSYSDSGSGNQQFQQMFDQMFGGHFGRPYRQEVRNQSFFSWLINHLEIVLAAVLISLGLINLCRCCCCCCLRKKDNAIATKKTKKDIPIKDNPINSNRNNYDRIIKANQNMNNSNNINLNRNKNINKNTNHHHHY